MIEAMYTIDGRDRVVELTDVPQSSVGAPLPMVMASESGLILAYYLQEEGPWDGVPRLVTPEDRQRCAVIRFESILAHTFGPPGDERLSRHPLYARGLGSYAVYEVHESSWLRQETGSVGKRGLRHFVFTFHDSMFECLAEEFQVETSYGSVHEVLVNAWRN